MRMFVHAVGPAWWCRRVLRSRCLPALFGERHGRLGRRVRVLGHDEIFSIDLYRGQRQAGRGKPASADPQRGRRAPQERWMGTSSWNLR